MRNRTSQNKVILVFVPDLNSRTTTPWKNQEVGPVELRELNCIRQGKGNKEKAEIPNPLIYRIHPLIKGKVQWVYSWPRSQKVASLNLDLHPVTVMCRLRPYGYDKRTWENVSPLHNYRNNTFFLGKHILIPITLLHQLTMPFLNPLSFIFISLSYKFIQKSVYFKYTFPKVINGDLVRLKTSLKNTAS